MKMKMYVYNSDTNEHIATITGKSNDAIDKAFLRHFDINGDFSGTYSPAFGATDGLVESEGAYEIDAELPDPVATIFNNDTQELIYLSVTKDADGYYVSDHYGADASQYRFASEGEAKASIDVMWSSPLWDLHWEF
jgi:hypothetical protein